MLFRSSKAFLKLCPITNIFSADENSKILEEPMAVTIGQSLFLEKFFPKRLKWDSKLYNHPWISAFSKSIYPIIKADFDTGKPFSVETGKKLGFVCDEFIKASRILSGSSK